jgi:hypothetical protein
MTADVAEINREVLLNGTVLETRVDVKVPKAPPPRRDAPASVRAEPESALAPPPLADPWAKLNKADGAPS